VVRWLLPPVLPEKGVHEVDGSIKRDYHRPFERRWIESHGLREAEQRVRDGSIALSPFEVLARPQLHR
jgi:hypothetical protein